MPPFSQVTWSWWGTAQWCKCRQCWMQRWPSAFPVEPVRLRWAQNLQSQKHWSESSPPLELSDPRRLAPLFSLQHLGSTSSRFRQNSFDLLITMNQNCPAWRNKCWSSFSASSTVILICSLECSVKKSFSKSCSCRPFIWELKVRDKELKVQVKGHSNINDENQLICYWWVWSNAEGRLRPSWNLTDCSGSSDFLDKHIWVSSA